MDLWPEGGRRALPLVVPMLTIGAAFGLLAEPVMGPLPPVVMSVVVFAGGAQFAALGVLTAGGAAGAAALAGALTNLRYLPTGFAVAPSLRGGRLRRSIEGQAVVDASFALAARGDGTFDRAVLLWSTAVQAVCWIGGTVLGVLAAGAIPDPEAWGIDVLLPVFFASLLAGELRRFGRTAVTVSVTAAALAVLTTPVLPAGLPIAVAALACVLALFRDRRGEVR
ncbi:AzlC family ABC transporter permease [Nocardioides taihuensis]|uniref:AzlC family ABC transporter permease n=1 Tax=Nocardioides taihuensis TaxID=1835606 RepID=A0ABW0BHN5_9ACTN